MKEKRIPPKDLQVNKKDASSSKSWKILQIMAEFIEGYERTATIEPAVSVFGSARIGEGQHYYQITQQICTQLSNRGFSIISGGGPGLMQAANKGAYDGTQGLSIGLNIYLPHEQRDNIFQDISLHFNNFFTRKMIFIERACAYVVMPGGFGTLDELSEIITLIQTKKERAVPVILVGSDFWSGLLEWMQRQLLAHNTIAASDLDILQMADSAEQVVAIIEDFYNNQREEQ